MPPRKRAAKKAAEPQMVAPPADDTMVAPGPDVTTAQDDETPADDETPDRGDDVQAAERAPEQQRHVRRPGLRLYRGDRRERFRTESEA